MSAHAAGTLLAPLLDKAVHQPNGVPFFKEAADGWQPVTHRQFLADVSTLAEELLRRGLNPGDRVGLLAAPGYECEVADKAILAVGAITVGIDSKASAADLGAIFHQAGLRGLFLDQPTAVARIPQPHLAALAWVGWLLDSPPHWPQLATFQLAEILRERRAARTFEARCRPQDIAVILFTSGTTGQPKGIPLRHAQVAPSARHLQEVFAAQLTQGPQRTLSWVPLHSGTGRLMSTCNYQLEVAQYFVSDPMTLLGKVQAVQPTALVVVPRILEKIHEQVQARLQAQPLWTRAVLRALLGWQSRLPRLRRIADRGPIPKIRRALFGDCLRYLICGAAPVAPSILRFFDALGVPTCEVYGLSEIGALVAMNRPGQARYGSVGRPLPGMEVQLATDHEIMVRSAFGLHEYWGESGAALYTPDGYLPTGDLGRFDRDGYLYLTGRKKDLIKTSTGLRIAPTAIEQVFQDIPGIEHFVVIGNGRKYLAALATLDTAYRHRLTAAGLDPQHYLAEEVEKRNPQLARNRQVRRVTLLPQPLSADRGELTATLLKVRRQAFEWTYRAAIDRMYAADDGGMGWAARAAPEDLMQGQQVRAVGAD